MNTYTQIGVKLKNAVKICCVVFTFFISMFSIFAAEVEVLKPSDGHAGDYFGSACSISDNYAVIGNYPEISHGQVYIFKKSLTDTWDEEEILTAPSPVKFDEFGFSVATEGDYVAVGSPGYGDNEGAVYIYKKEADSWILKQTLSQPIGAEVQNFGEVVAINGSYLLTSTPYADSGHNGKGFLYKRTGETWNLIKTFTAPASTPDDGDFGEWCAISDNYICISAPASQTDGQIFIYENNSDSWDLNATFTPPAGSFGLGFNVSITDTYAVCTGMTGDESESGVVFVYHNAGGVWSQSQVMNSPSSVFNMFGYSLSINDTALAISDPMNNFKGAVYTYTLNAEQWEFDEKYTGNNSFPSFGMSIDLHNNDFLLAGAPIESFETGQAYVWNLPTSVISISVNPTESGTTDPAADHQHKVTTNVPFDIKATPTSGYAFDGWVVNSGNVTIADPQNANTTATVDGVAKITATFIVGASVSFAVTPANSGSTTPSGTVKYAKGSRIPIRAVSAEGYYFYKWVVNGPAIFDNPLSPVTNVLINGDCSVTAVFQPFVKDVQLVMKLSPDSGGTILPSLGTHTVESTKLFNLKAEPASGMHFSKWTIEGNGSISEPLSSSTTASITEDSIITAFFAKNSSTVTLSMTASPIAGGTTNPSGDTTVNSNQPVQIEAHPADGYHFIDWSTTGSGSLDGRENVIAWVTLGGNATVSANFEKNLQQADLTMAIIPDDSGSTNPGTGVHSLNIGETYEIKAFPLSGYYFSKWDIDGNAKVTDPLLTDTYIVLTGDATVTAVFIKSTETTQLTIGISPEAGGTTNPGAGIHSLAVGSSMRLEAIPNTGYYFTHWSLTGQSIISDPDNAETIITVYGETSIIANFAEATTSATLTMQISPDNSGTVNPGIGTHTVVAGESFTITATAEDDYVFDRWQITGNAVVSDPEIRETALVLLGDAVVTAVFVEKKATARLILIVDPAEGGSTNPGIGIHTVPTGHKLVMEAIPAEGYVFVCWEPDENIEIDDRFAEKTAVELSANSSLTAVFTAKTTSVELTLAASPENSGTTNPGIGIHSVNVDDRIKIEAVSANGYHFTGWELTSGTAVIDNYIDQETYISLETDATVTATFAADETAVTLDMAITPADSGYTSPAVGSHNGLFAGQTIEIEAVAVDGYHFVNWNSNGAAIDNSLSTKTFATLSDDAAITANFASNDDQVFLVIKNSDVNAGLVFPLPGVHTYYSGESIKLEADPFDEYYFVKWELDGEGSIDDDKSEVAYAVLTADSTITAVFTSQKPVFLTQGAVINIDASGYDDSRKKVFATYYNTLKSSTKPKKTRFDNIVYDTDSMIITGEWRYNVKLYDPKDYPKGERLSDLLIANPVGDLKVYGIYVDSKGQQPLLTDYAGYIVSPIVDSVTGDHSEKGDVFIVKGRYFGAKVPSVKLEYTVNDKVKYKRCKVIRADSLRYMNAAKVANKSCMKVWASDVVDQEAVGYSQISVTYPFLTEKSQPTGYIIIKNSFGMATDAFSNTAE